MEVYQIVLMVIGALASIWLVVKIIKGIFNFLAAGLEAAFRNKYPYDFEINLGWVISELQTRGFRQTEVIDAESDNPGVILKHSETNIEMEIRLRAPLFSDKGYNIIVSNHDNKTAIVMQNNDSEENKTLLRKYLE